MMRKIATAVCLIAALSAKCSEAKPVNKGEPVRGTSRGMSNRNAKGHEKSKRFTNDNRRRLEPDVDEMDLSLFREHEEGFPGGLFYEDTEEEAKFQQMMPQWRQAGKAKKKGDKSWKSKKSCKKASGTGSTGGKGKSKKNCNDAPSFSPGPAPTSPSSPTFVTPTSPSSPTFVTPTAPTVSTPTVSTPTVSTPSVILLPPTGLGAVSSPTATSPSDPIRYDWDADSDICEAIATDSDLKKGGPATAFNDLSKKVDTNLMVRSKNGLKVPDLLDKYTRFVRLYTLGCFESADAELENISTRRRLITEPLFQAKMKKWSEDKKSCKGKDPKTCEYTNTVSVFYQNNGNTNPDEDQIKQRVRDALSEIAQALEQNPDVDDVEVDGIGVAQAVGQNTNDGNTSNAGTIVGATAAGLALLLFLLLWAKRNKDSDEVSHLKFVEDDDTFVNEIEGKNGGLDSDSDTEGRRVHVVGESDSVMSGWTGYSVDDDSVCPEADQSGKLGHTMGDVHMCSSATCEICERRRQMGVTFVKTSAPPMPERPPSVPSNATRDYVAEDVVAL